MAHENADQWFVIREDLAFSMFNIYDDSSATVLHRLLTSSTDIVVQCATLDDERYLAK